MKMVGNFLWVNFIFFPFFFFRVTSMDATKFCFLFFLFFISLSNALIRVDTQYAHTFQNIIPPGLTLISWTGGEFAPYGLFLEI